MVAVAVVAPPAVAEAVVAVVAVVPAKPPRCAPVHA
jgi:hypothetical protein